VASALSCDDPSLTSTTHCGETDGANNYACKCNGGEDCLTNQVCDGDGSADTLSGVCFWGQCTGTKDGRTAVSGSNCTCGASPRLF
jgi:hypothetical protein